MGKGDRHRVALQDRVRALLVSQGLPAPCGAKAWTALGLAGIAAYAKPLAECAVVELWRGRLEQARMGGAAYPDDWDGWLHEAETRIVECTRSVGGRRNEGILAGVSRPPAATRGLIAVPWTPASLSLLLNLTYPRLHS